MWGQEALKITGRIYYIAIIGIILAVVISKIKMEGPVNLHIQQLPPVLLMETVIGNSACMSIKNKKIGFFSQSLQKCQTPNDATLGSTPSMDEPISRPLGNCQKGKPRTLLKVSKRGGSRGGKRGGARSHKNRNNKQSKTLNFSVMGTNAAGLKAKKDS